MIPAGQAASHPHSELETPRESGEVRVWTQGPRAPPHARDSFHQGMLGSGMPALEPLGLPTQTAGVLHPPGEPSAKC